MVWEEERWQACRGTILGTRSTSAKTAASVIWACTFSVVNRLSGATLHCHNIYFVYVVVYRSTVIRASLVCTWLSMSRCSIIATSACASHHFCAQPSDPSPLRRAHPSSPGVQPLLVLSHSVYPTCSTLLACGS